jgi:DNA-binding NarL/FixJ family response regulator
MSGMSQIRALIVEDEPLIAENIAVYLLNNGYTVSGTAYDDEEARKQITSNTPDVVLMDINLGSEEDGIDLARFIHENYGLPVLFLTSYADRDTINRAKEVEPSAYILKPFTEKSLLSSLEIVLSNFSRKQVPQLPKLFPGKINRHLASPLSEREFDVLQRICSGKTNQEIADEVFISVNTVKKHLNSAYLKLDVTTRTKAIAKLMELTK